MAADQAFLEDENQADADRLIGTVLGGRYRIERKLGEGGMGSVYVGVHESIGKEVAIKCLNPEMSANKAIVERFKREARAATAAGNEHIIDVTDMGDLPDGSPYIVMELLQGRELAELIEEGPLSVGRAVRIMLQVCDALAAAHEKGIVHRDLKPENIFLVKRKRDADFVKVLDFGIARFNEPATIGGGKNLTATGMTMGTPHYMSPEQAQGLPNLDHRTDIYALGVILYEMLVGDTPFNAETFPLLIVQIVTADAPLLSVRRPDVPREFGTAVMRCFAKDREARFQTVEEFAKAIEPYVSLDTPPQMAPQLGELETIRPGANQAIKANRGANQLTDATSEIRPIGATEVERAIRRPSRVPLIVFGVGAVLALIGSIVWTLKQRPSEEDITQPATVESIDTPTAAQQPTPDEIETAESQTEESEVRLRVIVAPANARIFLDEQEFPSPLNARRPRSLEPVQLRIELDGYQTVEELLILDEDKELIRTLERNTASIRNTMRGSMATTMQRATMEASMSPTMGSSMSPTMQDNFRDVF